MCVCLFVCVSFGGEEIWDTFRAFLLVCLVASLVYVCWVACFMFILVFSDECDMQLVVLRSCFFGFIISGLQSIS